MPAKAPSGTRSSAARSEKQSSGKMAGLSLSGAVEAILLSVDRPQPVKKLSETLAAIGDFGEPEGVAEQIERAVEELNKAYESGGRAFRIEQVAGGYRLMTLPVYAQAIAAFHRERAAGRLSKAAVETLAIVAYRQPITRAQLEAIRGVGCGEVLRSLMDRRLVTIKGRAEELGRPILYGTTKEFLDTFGLASLKDLPTVAELAVES